jgi:phosphotransferase system HPr (HPr) family protein
MVRKEIVIKNGLGIQSRSAALFIRKASNYKSGIWIENGERNANAKSLLGLLSLGIAGGDRIVITAEGADEEEAVCELEEYLQASCHEVV